MKAWFVVVDEYRSGDVHGVHQTKTFHDAAAVNEFLDFWRDVDEPASVWYFKPKMFGERFQFLQRCSRFRQDRQKYSLQNVQRSQRKGDRCGLGVISYPHALRTPVWTGRKPRVREFK